MNLLKKAICTVIAAGIFISNISVGAGKSMIVNAESYSDEMQYGDYLSYEKVDEDDDGIYDYIQISDCDESAETVDIPNEIDGLPVTSIGDRAFEDCSGLTSITIPNSVTSIGKSAFYHCSLTSIEIPDSVTSIGDSAFEGCSYLKSITIPNSVTSIGNYAFYKCDLTSIEIPNSVTSIGDSAFEDCSYLKSITISDGVTSIGDRAFYECSRLTSIEIPDSVTSIGGWAFDGTPWLKAKQEEDPLVIVNSILIDGWTCSDDVKIPDSVTSIGDDAFGYCSGLTSIEIPDSVTSIGDRAFYECSSLTSINVSENNSNYSSIDGVLFDKDKTELICFPMGSEKTEYIIPDSVTSIGDRAFWNCSNLTSITIPDSVTSIGKNAFSDCWGLTSITIENPECKIYDMIFWINMYGSCDCVIRGYEHSTAQEYAAKRGFEFEALEEKPPVTPTEPTEPTPSGMGIEVENVTCYAGQTVYVPLTLFGTSSQGCEILLSVDDPLYISGDISDTFLSGRVGDDVYAIFSRYDAYADGAVIGKIEIYVSYAEPGEYPINISVIDLDSNGVPVENPIGINGTVTIVEDEPLVTTAPPTTTLPTTTTIINNIPSTLYHSDLLTYLSVDEDGDGISDYFTVDECDKSVEEIIIPSEFNGLPVKEIGDSAFWNCKSLTSITIPNGVTTIGRMAFQECKELKNINIPESVTTIKAYAFCMCESLEKIDIPESVISIESFAFFECHKLVEINLPSNVILSCEKYDNGNLHSPFNNCGSLTSVNIPEDSENYCSVDGVLFNKDKTEIICYPAGKTDSEYILPSSVTLIGSDAFRGSKYLKNISVSEDVTSIGYYAFAGCENLSSIYILNPECTIYFEAINNVWNKGKPDEFYGTIHGYKDSTAQAYAEEFGYTFKEIEEEMIGDISGNGKIDLYDAIEIAKYMVGKRTFTEAEMKIADVKKDGVIDLYDAIRIAEIMIENSKK